MTVEIISWSISTEVWDQTGTSDPWIRRQTRICSQTRYQLRYGARPGSRLNAVSRNYVRGQVQGHSDTIMLRDTSSSQDASTRQIWDSYLK